MAQKTVCDVCGNPAEFRVVVSTYLQVAQGFSGADGCAKDCCAKHYHDGRAYTQAKQDMEFIVNRALDIDRRKQ